MITWVQTASNHCGVLKSLSKKPQEWPLHFRVEYIIFKTANFQDTLGDVIIIDNYLIIYFRALIRRKCLFSFVILGLDYDFKMAGIHGQ